MHFWVFFLYLLLEKQQKLLVNKSLPLFISAFTESGQIPFSYYVFYKNTMIEENETCVLKVINKVITATSVSNKGFFNHQLKTSNNFMIVFSNSLQKHFCAFQVYISFFIQITNILAHCCIVCINKLCICLYLYSHCSLVIQ